MKPIDRITRILDTAKQFNSVPSKTIRKHLPTLINENKMLQKDNKRLRNKIKRLERERDEH